MKTFMAKSEEVKRDWWVVDATGKPLGRLAAEVAKLLRGKHKPIFTPHVDTGDHVIVINADRVKLTGNKAEDLIYWHTQYPGGLRSVTYGKLRQTRPVHLVERTIKGMLPHNRLGAAVYRKLKVYGGSEHPHAAQQPKLYEIQE
ncbi:MAG: 50S ribosomal protein L13 [Armatimonadetes bacterium]|nr:50S ribosomal protein L13 [Armatimonadota bacterium]